MISYERTSLNSDNLSLTAKGATTFFHYLKKFNLFKEPDLLILYPNSHFYYDENELKSVRTFINLKKLNLIKDPDTFLSTVFNILPQNINFIGCFSDNRELKGNSFISEISARLTNLLDSKTFNYLDKKVVTKLLEKHGYRVIDMTETVGLTFFYSKKITPIVESKA